MSWLLKHKFIILLVIAGAFYWIKNPADRFGFTRKGFIIYDRMPIAYFDCYVNSDGKLSLESDLSLSSAINYWIENHLQSEQTRKLKTPLLLVGTGFRNRREIKFTNEQVDKLRELDLEVKYLPSPAAVVLFNDMRDKELPVSILLKIK